MTDIFKFQKTKTYSHALLSALYSPSDIERLIDQSPEKTRQRRHSEFSYMGGFGEQSDTDRWKYSLQDITGLWLIDRYIQLEGISLRHAAAMAFVAAPSVTAAIALKSALTYSDRIGLVGPLENASGVIDYNMLAKKPLEKCLRQPKSAELRLIYLINLVDVAPSRLVDEIKNSLLDK